MERQIEIASDETQEGLCYELEEARREGLREEIRIFLGDRELKLTTEVFEWIKDQTDVGVNVSPNDPEEFELIVYYNYTYGRTIEAMPCD